MTDAEHQKWIDGWQKFMVDIWREKMMSFAPPVYDTGALSRSIQGVVHPGPVTTIEHRFLEYGIYVARGVGNGYYRGNPGDLKFLKDWKTNPHHRQPRDWFAKNTCIRCIVSTSSRRRTTVLLITVSCRRSCSSFSAAERTLLTALFRNCSCILIDLS